MILNIILLLLNIGSMIINHIVGNNKTDLAASFTAGWILGLIMMQLFT